MQVLGVHEPDPNHPDGMAWIFAAGICDPRPGGYPKKVYPNQQWALKQSWEPTSRMFWDLGLRWHPELATKWLEGGGQFALANIVDKPPIEPTMEELVEEFSEDQFSAMKAEIDRIMNEGTDLQKKRLMQRFRMAADQSKQVADWIENQIEELPDEQNLDKKHIKDS
jgi:hypothetical protein